MPILPLLLALAASLLLAAPAPAQDADEGQALLRAVEDGERSCAELSDADLERIGEYAMARMLGSAEAYEEMRRFSRRMMGDEADEMRRAMGERFSGCGPGRMPARFGSMMGAMGMMGEPRAGGRMMDREGRRGGPRNGPMRGFERRRADGDGRGWSVAGWVAAGAMGVLLLLALLTAWRWRPLSSGGGPRPGSPRETLDRRLAEGEISPDEYRRLLEVLEGGG